MPPQFGTRDFSPLIAFQWCVEALLEPVPKAVTGAPPQSPYVSRPEGLSKCKVPETVLFEDGRPHTWYRANSHGKMAARAPREWMGPSIDGREPKNLAAAWDNIYDAVLADLARRPSCLNAHGDEVDRRAPAVVLWLELTGVAGALQRIELQLDHFERLRNMERLHYSGHEHTVIQ